MFRSVSNVLNINKMAPYAVWVAHVGSSSGMAASTGTFPAHTRSGSCAAPWTTALHNTGEHSPRNSAQSKR